MGSIIRQASRLVLAGLACLAATGCITSTTLVKVKADGSGTIEQTLSMKPAAAEQFKAMMAGFGGPRGEAAAGDAGPTEIFSEKEMRDAAPRLGEGVTFVSSRTLNDAERVGRVAVYAFTDITKLRVDQKPPAPGAAGALAPSGGPEEIRFAFARLPNGHSQLSIRFPEPKTIEAKANDGATAAPKKAPKPDPAQLEMMKKMFDGLKIDVVVEVAGPIVKTNSPYVDGRRVTVLEMDFSQLLANQAELEQLAQPKSIEDAKQALKNIKGFKVNLDKELTVEFAAR